MQVIVGKRIAKKYGLQAFTPIEASKAKKNADKYGLIYVRRDSQRAVLLRRSEYVEVSE